MAKKAKPSEGDQAGEETPGSAPRETVHVMLADGSMREMWPEEAEAYEAELAKAGK